MTRHNRIFLINLVFITPCHPQPSSSLPSDSICSRTDVLFCTGFEEPDWRLQWDDYDGNPVGSDDLLADPGPFNTGGNHVMRLRSPAGARGGADLVKVLSTSQKRLYVRWYQKWETGYNFAAGCHNGGLHAGDRNYLGASDNRPSGSDWFSAWLEPCGEDRLHFYAYYRGMYMDCVDPAGQCWGDHLPCMLNDNYCTNPKDKAPPKPLPPAPVPNRWYCFEIMADAGTPTTDTAAIHPDGILNFWVDGIEYGPFENLWLRTSANVNIGIIHLSLFNHDGTHSTEGIMVDDVVASTSPIGLRGQSGVEKSFDRKKNRSHTIRMMNNRSFKLESGNDQPRNSIELFDINGKRITVDRQMTGGGTGFRLYNCRC